MIMADLNMKWNVESFTTDTTYTLLVVVESFAPASFEMSMPEALGFPSLRYHRMIAVW